jgi:hypothetical protein
MISFARLFGRSGFGLGVALGLIITLHLHSLVQARPLPITDTTCEQTLSVPPEVQDWIDMQCVVNNAIFDDGLEPTAAFAIDTAVTQPGTYAGEAYDGREISLEAAFVVEADLENEAPELILDGVSAYLVIARLSGAAGNLPVVGLVMQTGTYTPDTEYLLLVCDVMSEEDFSLFADATRIAGGVRVLDVGTFTSEPLSSTEMTGTIWMAENDPATLYRDEPGGQGGGIDLNCIRAAYKAYQIAVDAARAVTAICVAGVVGLFAVCMGALLATAWLLGPIGPIAAGIGAAACLSELSIGLAGCTAIAAIEMNAAAQQLQAALLGCGVIIA